MTDGDDIISNTNQSSISLLSCIWILLIVSLSAVLFVFFLAWKYKTFRQSGWSDAWLTFLLVCGALLSYGSIFPLAARVYFAVQIPTRLAAAELLQLGTWFLSVGCSLMFGSQAVLSWRRWKIQNSHFYIRVEYLASILALIILVDFAQLTLWHTTDPFRCAERTKTTIDCTVHYLPLWLLSNFLHKGVLILTTVVYSWRLQLLSTSRTILRSLSGCTLLSSSCVCICICLLSPLVCIANQYQSLQHLSLTIAILLSTTSTTILHFIPKILNANARRSDQIVRVRQSIHYPDTPSEHFRKQSHLASSIGDRVSLLDHHSRHSNSYLRVPTNKPVKTSVRIGSSREMMMKARKHHKSCSHIVNPVSSSRIELSRVSQVSSGSTRTPISTPPNQPPRRSSTKQTTRIRKSFSLNDMKQFLVENGRKDDITLLDSRLPEPVIHTKENLLKPLIQQDRISFANPAQSSANPFQSFVNPHQSTTPSISPSSSAKSLRAAEDDEGSLASKMWLTPSILRSNPINFIRLGSLSNGLSIKETENPVII